jgi:demethylmenaquinone methyltransferase/2-methoxy-6-polyprenyl-1,4-benzoquinol methylase
VRLHVLRQLLHGRDSTLHGGGELTVLCGGAERVEIREGRTTGLTGLCTVDGLLHHLAEGGNRRCITDPLAVSHRQAGIVEDEPALDTLGASEGAQVGAFARGRLDGQDRRDVLAWQCVVRGCLRDPVEVVRQRHDAKNRLGSVGEAASARTLFAPLGPTYDRYAAVLSLGQDPRWRRFLVTRIEAGARDTVLDVATGTGAVARELLARKGCNVVGLDQSPEMLAEARRRLPASVKLMEGTAEALPFADASFEGLTFTYLLRYVPDPGATLRELARVVRPGGSIAGLEFGVPRGIWRPLWELYVRVGLPVGGRTISKGWADVGDFLGPSIRDFYARWPEGRLLESWRSAGIADVQSRRLSLGGGIVTWGRRA